MPPVDRDKQGGRADDGLPLVSVVVAAYNAKNYIAETCRSVLKQSYTALEIIIVDDGSADGTGEIAAGLAESDPRIRVIRQVNQGVAAARNRGIDAATGEFIAPLDADDLWHPTKIARQVQRMRESGPETAMAYCWWVWIDSKGSVLDRSPRWEVEGRVLEQLVEVNFTGSASVPLFRRSAVQAIGGYNTRLKDADAQGCEDWDLALRLAETHKVVMVPAVLVGYRRHDASMSSACDTMWRSQAQVMGALAARHPNVPAHVFHRSNGQFALHLAGVAFWSGHYAQACLWALRARPFSLTLSVIPHVARILVRRMLRLDRTRPVWSPQAGMDEKSLPEPLIPYDAIYTRHWNSQRE